MKSTQHVLSDLSVSDQPACFQLTVCSSQCSLDLWRAPAHDGQKVAGIQAPESSIKIENDMQLSEAVGSRYLSSLKARCENVTI